LLASPPRSGGGSPRATWHLKLTCGGHGAKSAFAQPTAADVASGKFCRRTSRSLRGIERAAPGVQAFGSGPLLPEAFSLFEDTR
jgi:hypothetical protein